METSAPAPPAVKETVSAQAAVADLVKTPTSEKRSMRVDQQLLMSEVQLLLAEKRTTFALMRTGITVALLPLSIWTVLVATSRLWNVWEVLWLLIPLVAVAGALFLLGCYLIVHAMHNLAHTDRVLLGLRRSDTLLEDLLVSHGQASRVLNPWRWRDAIFNRRKGSGS